MLKDPLPHPRLRPAREARVNLDWIAEPLRQIAPRHASAIAIEDRLDEQPIVARGHADVPLATRKQISDPVPLIFTKGVTAQGQPPIRLAPYESRNLSQRKPAIEDRP